MPITPLPPDNTKRYRLVYTVAGREHRMMSRCGSGMTDATAIGHLNAVAVALAPYMFSDVSFIGVEVLAAGSDVSNPVSGWTVVNGGQPGAMPAAAAARSWAISGRSSTGRKARVYWYGSNIPQPATWEEDPLVTASFQGFQGLLNS